MSAYGEALLAQLDADDRRQLAEMIAPHIEMAAESNLRNGWVNSKDAAAYLGLSLDALHKRTQRREIPASQETVGGKLYFRRADLEDWRLQRSKPQRGAPELP